MKTLVIVAAVSFFIGSSAGAVSAGDSKVSVVAKSTVTVATGGVGNSSSAAKSKNIDGQKLTAKRMAKGMHARKTKNATGEAVKHSTAAVSGATAAKMPVAPVAKSGK